MYYEIIKVPAKVLSLSCANYYLINSLDHEGDRICLKLFSGAETLFFKRLIGKRVIEALIFTRAPYPIIH